MKGMYKLFIKKNSPVIILPANRTRFLTKSKPEKNILRSIILIFLIFIYCNLAEAGINPTFNMTAKNITRHPGQNGQDSIITFEIYLQQTNQGQPGVYDFEYCCAQYTFRYNKLIHSPGGNLVFGIIPDSCELPPNLRPPSFQVDSANGYLKASGNLPQSLTNFFISGTFPGTRILTFKARTNNKVLNMVPLNLKFKLGPSPNTFVACFVPYPDTVDSQQHPNQYALALMDTVENHYSIEDSASNYEIQLYSPNNNSSTNHRYINFSWQDIGVISYKLEISTDVNFNNIVYSDSSILNASKTVSTLNPDTTYYWKVSGKNDSVYFADSEIRYFRTSSNQIFLNRPDNNQSLVSLPVKFSWHITGQTSSASSVILADRNSENKIFNKASSSKDLLSVTDFSSNIYYKLEVATDSILNNIVFSDSTISDTFKVVSNLNLITGYYWKVSPQNDSLFLNSSDVWRFTTVADSIQLNSPEDNALSVLLPVNFSWYTTNNSFLYRLQIASDPDFQNTVFNDSAITDTFKTVNSLLLGTHYYWKVSAKNDSEYFAVSQTRNFTTYDLLISPANDSTIVPIAINFLWHKVDSTVNYIFQLSNNNSFNFLIVNDSTLTDTLKTVNVLLDGYYYWRVSAVTLNNVLNSNIRHFRTTGTVLIEPPLYLNGFNVVPPNSTTAIGNLAGIYTDSTNTFSLYMEFSGITGTTTSAHLHGPAYPGYNAPVQIDFAGFPLGVSSGVYMNSYILTPEQVFQLYSGQWYVDIHSTSFPEGEIRAQINFQALYPVELTGFSSSTFKDNVTLNWSTSGETNNSRFEIERSTNKSEWINAGNVAGSGNTNEPKNYSFTERLISGKYDYRLKQIDFNGNFEYFYLSNEVEVGIPDRYFLSQNYPNPFNPSTTIDFELPSDGKVSLIIYDISGREIEKLLNESRTAGYYSVNFNASNLASGIYFYMITVNEFRLTKKMVVVK